MFSGSATAAAAPPPALLLPEDEEGAEAADAGGSLDQQGGAGSQGADKAEGGARRRRDGELRYHWSLASYLPPALQEVCAACAVHERVVPCACVLWVVVPRCSAAVVRSRKWPIDQPVVDSD